MALALVSLVLGTATGHCAETGGLCGPETLVLVCRGLGVETGLEEVSRLCGYDEKKGTTLLGLQNAAKAKGLEALGVKIGVEELAGIKTAAIACLWGNHFVVVEAGDAESIRVTNPPDEPRLVKKEDFKKVYSGFALVVAKDARLLPTPKAQGPDLRFEGYVWDFGVLDEGEHIEHVFKCRNVGNEDVVISSVKASCGDCLVPVGGPQTIPVGGSGEIKAVLTTVDQRRRVVAELYVSSNDPISPVVHLGVTGYVRSERFPSSPGRVNFGRPRRTQTLSAEVYVPSFEEERIEIASVYSDSPYVTAEVLPSKHKDRPGCFITATLKPDAPLGNIKGEVTIHTDDPDQPLIEVPVYAYVE